MKKNILLVVFAMLVLWSFGQTGLKIAPDFTAITMDQDTFNLNEFWQENPDKYVALEFFISETPLCQETSIYVSDAYQQFGCNDHDVVFLSINVGNDSAVCQEYINSLNLQSQVVTGYINSGDSTLKNGDSIAASFEIESYPTFILMGSEIFEGFDLIVTDTIEESDTTYFVYDTTYFDYNIVERDLWPIYSANMIVDTLMKYDISKHECGPSAIFDPFEKREYVFILSPNPAQSHVRIQSTEIDGWITYQIYDVSGKAHIEKRIYLQSGEGIEVNTSTLNKGIYFVRLFNQDKSSTQKLMIQ